MLTFLESGLRIWAALIQEFFCFVLFYFGGGGAGRNSTRLSSPVYTVAFPNQFVAAGDKVCRCPEGNYTINCLVTR